MNGVGIRKDITQLIIIRDLSAELIFNLPKRYVNFNVFGLGQCHSTFFYPLYMYNISLNNYIFFS